MSNSSAPSNPPESRDIATYLARRIVILRSAAGLNTNQLAERAGMGFSTLSELEEGMHAPSIKSLLKLVRALDLASIEDLTGGTAALLWIAEREEGGGAGSA